MKTACKDCKFHLCVAQNQMADVWYNHFCKASPTPPKFDPITGKHEEDGYRYEFCKDINKSGNCPKFEER